MSVQAASPPTPLFYPKKLSNISHVGWQWFSLLVANCQTEQGFLGRDRDRVLPHPRRSPENLVRSVSLEHFVVNFEANFVEAIVRSEDY